MAVLNTINVYLYYCLIWTKYGYQTFYMPKKELQVSLKQDDRIVLIYGLRFPVAVRLPILLRRLLLALALFAVAVAVGALGASLASRRADQTQTSELRASRSGYEPTMHAEVSELTPFETSFKVGHSDSTTK